MIERVCVWCLCPQVQASKTACPAPDGDGHLFIKARACGSGAAGGHVKYVAVDPATPQSASPAPVATNERNPAHFNR